MANSLMCPAIIPSIRDFKCSPDGTIFELNLSEIIFFSWDFVRNNPLPFNNQAGRKLRGKNTLLNIFLN